MLISIKEGYRLFTIIILIKIIFKELIYTIIINYNEFFNINIKSRKVFITLS